MKTQEKSAKSTPKKWEVVRRGEVSGFDLQVWAEKSRICTLNDNLPEARSHASVIAAAPEMLEALKAAEAELEQCEPPDEYPAMQASWAEIMGAVRSAIAKAEGK